MIGFVDAFNLLWLIGVSISNIQSSDIGKCLSYEPVNLAFKIFEPITGSEETLSPIIFIHGLTSTKETWNDIPQKIADSTRRKAYAYDVRNHGESDYSDYFSFDLNVEDLFHFMDRHNISKAVLVGHSMGGYAATYAALSKPERIEKVFVEDMFVKQLPPALLDAAVTMLSMRRESILHTPKGLSENEAIDFSNEYMISKIPKDSPWSKNIDEIRKSTVSIKKKSDGSYDVNYNFDVVIKALKNSDTLSSDPKGQYNGPVFFLYGQISFIGLQNEKESIRKHLPQAEFIEFPSAGHLIHTFYPDEFVAKVLNHL